MRIKGETDDFYDMINTHRSTQLLPLCKEHLDGLMFVNHLKQGLNNCTDLHQLSQYTRWFWKHHIRPHFFQEEKILLPYLPPQHPFAERLKNDHAEILELMIEIDRDVQRQDLEHLVRFINSHIAWEESELYSWLESNLTEKELNGIYVKLNLHPVHCNTEWSNAFWLN